MGLPSTQTFGEPAIVEIGAMSEAHSQALRGIREEVLRLARARREVPPSGASAARLLLKSCRSE
eukprot:2948204-Alexandrium_andersonii.AAC.1